MRKKIVLSYILITLFLMFPLNSYAYETGATNIGTFSITDSLGTYEDVVGGSNYVYLAQAGVNDAALVIVDISVPTSPSLVGKGSRPLSHSIKCVDVNEDESIAVIGASTYVYVFNISNKGSPIRTDIISV
ncbi:MAG: hypothetical protein EU547_07815, partial [Promethearchaeota archaeon]